MYEFRPFVESELVEMPFDEILHRLYIMIGSPLDFLDLHRLLRSKILIDAAHCLIFALVNVLELRQRQFAECDEILDFHTHAVSDQCKFTEICSERFCLGCVTAVNR